MFTGTPFACARASVKKLLSGRKRMFGIFANSSGTDSRALSRINSSKNGKRDT